MILRNLNIFDIRKKKEQLRENGKYPLRYAFDYLRYAPRPHLTKEQTDHLIYAIAWRSGTWDQDLLTHLAEKRISDVIARMMDIRNR